MSASLDDLPLFRAAQRAIKRSGEHAMSPWARAALAAVRATAISHPSFTVDDVWPELTKATASGFLTHDYRALGAVMRHAAKRGWICQTGEYRKSFVRNHGTPRPVWRSLLFDGGARAA